MPFTHIPHKTFLPHLLYLSLLPSLHKHIFFLSHLRVIYLHVSFSVNISVYIAQKTRIFPYITTVQFSKQEFNIDIILWSNPTDLIQMSSVIPTMSFIPKENPESCIFSCCVSLVSFRLDIQCFFVFHDFDIFERYRPN